MGEHILEKVCVQAGWRSLRPVKKAQKIPKCRTAVMCQLSERLDNSMICCVSNLGIFHLGLGKAFLTHLSRRLTR